MTFFFRFYKHITTRCFMNLTRVEVIIILFNFYVTSHNGSVVGANINISFII